MQSIGRTDIPTLRWTILKRGIILLAVFLGLYGCAQHVKIPTEDVYHVYTVQNITNNPTAHFAPLFLVHGYKKDFNRIGRPSAKYDKNGKESIYVDSENPVVFYTVKNFSTDKDEYTNYIYRVHFPSVPFSLIPFHLSAGNNVGLMIVITVDSENRPVLITAVHACGCYLAILPTSYLSSDALPEIWKEEPVKVYGERLPWKLDYKEKKNPRLLVHLRPDVHRVMNLEIIEEHNLHTRRDFKMIITPLAHMDELERIPVNGKTTSFYYKEGPLRGHVRGSVKLWESIILGMISLDMFVGTDKVYSGPGTTGSPFYTSLKPWNRNSSDMRDFTGFLKFWGWRL